jgi:methylthioribose-1-phosphate isomerase
MLRITDPEAMRDAIRRLAVRGAPAIGIAAAFGTVLGVRSSPATTEAAFLEHLDNSCQRMASARPTAVNPSWALERLKARAQTLSGRGVPAMKAAVHAEALAILDEDRAICRRLGEIGADLIRDGQTVLTHCNTGALATGEHGTALAAVFEAHSRSKRVSVYATETRPLLQGARLTTWELLQAGIDVTLICDGMAAQVMKEGRVHAVLVGADRIAANGDTANKIGTYGLALLAREHGLPFYVVAPRSTFDLSLASGAEIPIEERPPEEVTCVGGQRIAPHGIKVYAPAFDVTPARYITGIVTERGLITPVTAETVRRTLGEG